MKVMLIVSSSEGTSEEGETKPQELKGVTRKRLRMVVLRTSERVAFNKSSIMWAEPPKK
jgi:hypothetical protein